jgi:exopolysaccharide biosynthesis polyprenyl glycosylphosphotransferase
MLMLQSSLAKRTLILGTGPRAWELIDILNHGTQREYVLVGVVSELNPGDTASSFSPPVLGSLEELERILVEQQPDRIICALAEHSPHLPIQQLVSARVFRGILVESADEVYERLAGKLPIDSLTHSDVIFSRDFSPSVPAVLFARALSLLVAVLGLVMFAPLYGLIVIAIKSNSPGPVLFVQERVGLRGRCFRMLKFRTMRPATERRSEWAVDNDDRITPVGRWLRRYRLDEMPQFINVLRGDMNLVGPRPHPVSNYEMLTLVSRNLPECGEPIPLYALRSLIRPGLTGWAQVRYRYANDVDEEMEKMRYDLYYIKHYSIGLDLRILFETIGVIFFRHERRVHKMLYVQDPSGVRHN